MLGGFRAAHHQFAAEKFLIVQLLYRSPCFIDRLHLNESEAFGALVMPITNNLGVVHVTDTIKELEQIALRGVEGQIADVKTRRSDFDRFGFAQRPLLRLLLMRAVR